MLAIAYILADLRRVLFFAFAHVFAAAFVIAVVVVGVCVCWFYISVFCLSPWASLSFHPFSSPYNGFHLLFIGLRCALTVAAVVLMGVRLFVQACHGCMLVVVDAS